MSDETSYVSRGGLKLAAALDAFNLNVASQTCADLGCSTGGFTDCLLQHNAQHIYAVDTGYGQLTWKLRQDDRVTVLERTNAVHFDPWAKLPDFAGCDLVVIDLGWTRQDKVLPVALRWLKDSPDARIITLVKPHYESKGQAVQGGRKGVLSDDEALEIHQRVLSEMPELGVEVLGDIVSPIRGGKGGNIEYLALLKRAST